MERPDWGCASAVHVHRRCCGNCRLHTLLAAAHGPPLHTAAISGQTSFVGRAAVAAGRSARPDPAVCHEQPKGRQPKGAEDPASWPPSPLPPGLPRRSRRQGPHGGRPRALPVEASLGGVLCGEDLPAAAARGVSAGMHARARWLPLDVHARAEPLATQSWPLVWAWAGLVGRGSVGQADTRTDHSGSLSESRRFLISLALTVCQVGRVWF